MALTNGQKKALHTAARQAGLGDEDRRLVQRNIGGFYSAADATATRRGFIACMAFYETRSGGQLAGSQSGYWRAEDAKANPTDSLVHRIRVEADAVGMSAADVDAFLASDKMSSGHCQGVNVAPAYWLNKLLSALIAMRKRGYHRRDR
jgi:hypothetical protein